MKDINNFIYERLTINNVNDGDKFEVKRTLRDCKEEHIMECVKQMILI